MERATFNSFIDLVYYISLKAKGHINKRKKQIFN